MDRGGATRGDESVAGVLGGPGDVVRRQQRLSLSRCARAQSVRCLSQSSTWLRLPRAAACRSQAQFRGRRSRSLRGARASPPSEGARHRKAREEALASARSTARELAVLPRSSTREPKVSWTHTDTHSTAMATPCTP
eukprot:2276510-Prymnesium_polylepis.1